MKEENDEEEKKMMILKMVKWKMKMKDDDHESDEHAFSLAHVMLEPVASVRFADRSNACKRSKRGGIKHDRVECKQTSCSLLSFVALLEPSACCAGFVAPGFVAEPAFLTEFHQTGSQKKIDRVTRNKRKKV